MYIEKEKEQRIPGPFNYQNQTLSSQSEILIMWRLLHFSKHFKEK